MTTPEGRGELLGELLNEHRLTLGLSWEDVSRRTGVGLSSLRYIRAGRPPRDYTAARIERGLGLAPRAIRQLLDGKTTRLLLAGDSPPPASELPRIVAANISDPVVLDVWESGLSDAGKMELITRYLEFRDAGTPPAAASSQR